MSYDAVCIPEDLCVSIMNCTAGITNKTQSTTEVNIKSNANK